jgi:hypothetical protein
MAFAPHPPAGYLSHPARTQGEMKTAFENSLLASKQTGGHGQCRLTVTSATALKLVTVGGRRVLVNDQPFLVPTAGLFLTNAGFVANTLYVVTLWDELADGNVRLQAYGYAPPITIEPDPDSGMLGLYQSGVRQPRHTPVGLIRTNASSQFEASGSLSFYNAALATSWIGAGPLTTGSTTNILVASLIVAAYPGDHMFAIAHLDLRCPVITGVTAGLYQQSFLGTSAYSIIAANGATPMTLHAPCIASGNLAAFEVYLNVAAAGQSVTIQSALLTVTRLA